MHKQVAGGKGFLMLPDSDWRRGEPERCSAMQAAPPTPPVPAAQAEARGPGESLPRESGTPGAHPPPRGEEHSSPGPPETLLDADAAALERETEGKRSEGSFQMSLVSRKQANVLCEKSRSGDGCQLLHGKRKEAAAPWTLTVAGKMLPRGNISKGLTRDLGSRLWI